LLEKPCQLKILVYTTACFIGRYVDLQAKIAYAALCALQIIEKEKEKCCLAEMKIPLIVA
jgi:hypothetical protein